MSRTHSRGLLLLRGAFFFLEGSSSPSRMMRRFVSSSASMDSMIASVCDRLTQRVCPSEVMNTEAKRLVGLYSQSSDQDKDRFFHLLAQRYGVDHERLNKTVRDYLGQEKENLRQGFAREVNLISQPRFYPILQSIGNLPGGAKFICDMRQRLLSLIRSTAPSVESSALRRLETTCRDLLTLWFCLSMLSLERMTWQSPSDILNKGLIDMQRRLGPHRRCFVFMHQALPREPLVIVHVALMDRIADSIQDVIKKEALNDEEGHDDTAIFYSISSTQPGLHGIDLGNMLIKQVVVHLLQQSDSFHIKTFATLSPLPSFRSWLLRSLKLADRKDDDDIVLMDESVLRSLPDYSSTTIDGNVEEKARRYLIGENEEKARRYLIGEIESNDWERYERLKTVLMRFAAIYLIRQKKSNGGAYDPVANFHLQNGAEIYRLNWRGDTSAKGLRQSLGIMVNYRYRLERLQSNSSQYIQHRTIEMDQLIRDVLNQ